MLPDVTLRHTYVSMLACVCVCVCVCVYRFTFVADTERDVLISGHPGNAAGNLYQVKGMHSVSGVQRPLYANNWSSRLQAPQRYDALPRSFWRDAAWPDSEEEGGWD